jgi:predicted  nucleic acid-binding Zn-ribbon protein
VSRYLGLLLDDVSPQDLPEPFCDMETAPWTSWFAADAPSFDDGRFVSLLTILEEATGHKHLLRTAQALAVRDSETARLRTMVHAQADTVSGLRASLERLEKTLATRDAELAQRDHDMSMLSGRIVGLDEKISILGSERETLNEQARALDEKLRNMSEEASSAHKNLENANRALTDLQSVRTSLEREIEDARNGLAAALRQQKALQGQIEADDQTIRHIMTQREELIQARDKLERDRARMAQQIGESERRLADSEQRRETYVSALIERKKEIDALSDKLISSDAGTKHLSLQADALQKTVQSWGHVPWRGIAAGSVAAGALLSAGFIFAGQAVKSAFSERSQTAQSETIVPTQSVAVPPAVEPAEDTTPKIDAKIAPDTLQVVDSSGETASSEPSAPNSTEIQIPEESGAPELNDQVEFNPEGLPPIDPDSRPPPQDLPPMQQRPKLLLKPVIPPDAGVR